MNIKTQKALYFGEFKYGSVRIAKANVIRETDKTFFLDETEDILGNLWIGRKIKKDRYFYDENVKIVLKTCLIEMENHIEKVRTDLIKMEKEEKLLLTLLDEDLN